MILRVEHSARRERHVVKEPAPAIRGKTRGTIVELPSAASFLKIVMLNVISIAKAIRTIAPAIANDARQGSDYQEILHHFYDGIKIEKN